MKSFKFLGALSMLLGLVVCSSCGDDDEFPTFKFDGDGTCYYPSVSAISKESFGETVVGYGWKHVSTYEIEENGECLKKEYYTDLEGAGPHYYYFESATTLKTYMHMDAYPANGFRTSAFEYMDANRVVGNNQHTILQIVSVDKDLLKVVEYLAVRAGGQKIYGYSIYKRMSAQELEQCQKNYAVDLSNPHELLLSVAEDTIFISGKSYSFEILDGNGNFQVRGERDDICTVSLEGNQINVNLLKNGAKVHISDRLKNKSVWIFSTDKSLEPTDDGIYDLGFETFVFNKNKDMFTRDGTSLSYKYLSMPLLLREGVSDGNLAQRNPVAAVVVDWNNNARHIPWDRQGFVRDILPQTVVDGLIVANTTDMYQYDFKLELVNCYGVVFQVLPFRVFYKSDFKEGDSWAIK